jgi:hypothetical protein
MAAGHPAPVPPLAFKPFHGYLQKSQKHHQTQSDFAFCVRDQHCVRNIIQHASALRKHEQLAITHLDISACDVGGAEQRSGQ